MDPAFTRRQAEVTTTRNSTATRAKADPVAESTAEPRAIRSSPGRAYGGSLIDDLVGIYSQNSTGSQRFMAAIGLTCNCNKRCIIGRIDDNNVSVTRSAVRGQHVESLS